MTKNLSYQHANGRLTGKIAIVTGVGRLKGIGAAICRQLASEGADIFFTYWSGYDSNMPWGIQSEDPALLAEELKSMGVRCISYEANLANTEEIANIFEIAIEKLGQPHILINNACHSVNDSFETVTVESIDAHYALNVRAPLLLSSEFAKRYSYHGGGRIVSMTSGQSLGPMAGEISYATTKGAIEAMTLTLAAEVGKKGITVNAVDPGPTDTGWMDEPLREHLAPMFSLGRVGEPADAARLISFLCSDDGGWVTGQVIHSHGGFFG